jgi:hypothetical protein
MVRRAAAANLGKLATAIHQAGEVAFLKSELLPLFTTLSSDEQDSVRLLAVQNCVSIAKVLSIGENQAVVLPIVRAVSQDTSWRVRYVVAEHLSELVPSLGARPIPTLLSSAYARAPIRRRCARSHPPPDALARSFAPPALPPHCSVAHLAVLCASRGGSHTARDGADVCAAAPGPGGRGPFSSSDKADRLRADAHAADGVDALYALCDGDVRRPISTCACARGAATAWPASHSA